MTIMNRINRHRTGLATLLASLAGALTVAAAEPTLGVGDAAPKLKTGKWVQGEAVKEFKKDKAYIVEFWATWCGPCRASIPHLNEVYQKFKDKGLVVIGQNVWERDESLVQPFVTKMGEKMTYRVAMDDKSEQKEGAMAETWMKAAGQNGIPAAFLVGKDGKIAWIGHPMSLPEPVIEQVLAGKFDLQKAAADFKKQRESEGALAKLSRQFNQQMGAKKWNEAEDTLAEIAKLLPDDRKQATASARLRILLGKGDLDGAAELADKLGEKSKDNAAAQNELAWQLVCQENIKGNALAIAYKLATRANQASGGQDPAVLDTLARATYLKGEKAKAIELQQKAVESAENENLKKQLQASLDSYKEGKLPKAD